MITPPPTPVPIVIIMLVLYPLAPPSQNSPSAAILASFPTLTFIPVFSDISFSTLKMSQPRLTHLLKTPFSVTAPGTPIPIPHTSSALIL